MEKPQKLSNVEGIIKEINGKHFIVAGNKTYNPGNSLSRGMKKDNLPVIFSGITVPAPNSRIISVKLSVITTNVKRPASTSTPPKKPTKPTRSTITKKVLKATESVNSKGVSKNPSKSPAKPTRKPTKSTIITKKVLKATESVNSKGISKVKPTVKPATPKITLPPIKEEKGTVETKGKLWIIAVNNTHYLPGVSLPKAFRTDGKKIIFSADRLPIPKGVRMAGNPIKITKIQSQIQKASPKPPEKKPVGNKLVRKVNATVVNKAGHWALVDGTDHYLPGKTLPDKYKKAGLKVQFNATAVMSQKSAMGIPALVISIQPV